MVILYPLKYLCLKLALVQRKRLRHLLVQVGILYSRIAGRSHLAPSAPVERMLAERPEIHSEGSALRWFEFLRTHRAEQSIFQFTVPHALSKDLRLRRKMGLICFPRKSALPPHEVGPSAEALAFHTRLLGQGGKARRYLVQREPLCISLVSQTENGVSCDHRRSLNHVGRSGRHEDDRYGRVVWRHK